MPERSPNRTQGSRIAKLIAHGGICSRRDAEKLILAGRVTYKGVIVPSPALTVENAADIRVDGQPLAVRPEVIIWKYHKPRGVISTKRDTHNRPTIYDTIPANLGHIVNVGRLDGESEGLMLFTNNGDIARKLTHPETCLQRVYDVTVSGAIPPDMLTKIAKGVTIDGIHYRPARCVIISVLAHNSVILRFTLTEGKNREIRNIAGFFGLRVTRLVRMSYGGITLDKLTPGHFECVNSASMSTIIKKIINEYNIN